MFCKKKPFEEQSCLLLDRISSAEFSFCFSASTKIGKQLACLYCGNLYSHRISEHLEKRHGDEQEVAKCLALRPNSSERKLAFQKLLYRGNFQHNVSILNGEKTGNLIVVRRSRCRDNDPSLFLPCTICCGFFKRTELWRHFKSCPHRPPHENIKKEGKSQGLLADSQLFLNSAIISENSKNSDKTELDPVLVKMHRDDIFLNFLENDSLILKFGVVLKTKLGLRRKNNVAQRMRQLARLKKEMKMDSLDEAIKGSKFNDVVAGVHRICGFRPSGDGIYVFEKPGLALRLGHNVKKAAHIKYGIAIRQDDSVAQREAEVFLTLLKQEWTDKVSSVSLASLATNKFEKPQLLPCTEDLTKLADYVDNEIKALTTLLGEGEPQYSVWRSLSEVTMVKVVLFNKRRGGEVEDLRLDAYLNRKKSAQGLINKEIKDSLSPLENQLVERYLYT